MNAIMKPIECDFDSSEIECVREEFIRLADEIDANWEHGDLPAACNAMEEFGRVLRNGAHTGPAACRHLKHILLRAIDALIRAWPTNRLANAVSHVIGLAEAMKSN